MRSWPDVVGEPARAQRDFGFAVVDRRARRQDLAIRHARLVYGSAAGQKRTEVRPEREQSERAAPYARDSFLRLVRRRSANGAAVPTSCIALAAAFSASPWR